jgi:hypothetical protein
MQMRQLRLPKKSRNMVKFPVRVIYKTEKEFYGVLRITADTIEVILFDGEVDPFFFTEDHINGCNPLGLSLNLTSSMRPQCTIIFKKKVARWPHGCRRKYSEVAVPMLVGSNPTEGGRIFSKEGTSAGADGRVVEGRINTLSATTARSARVRVPSGKAPMGV